MSQLSRYISLFQCLKNHLLFCIFSQRISLINGLIIFIRSSLYGKISALCMHILLVNIFIIKMSIFSLVCYNPLQTLPPPIKHNIKHNIYVHLPPNSQIQIIHENNPYAHFSQRQTYELLNVNKSTSYNSLHHYRTNPTINQSINQSINYPTAILTSAIQPARSQSLHPYQQTLIDACHFCFKRDVPPIFLNFS